MSEAIVVFMTARDAVEARRIAEQLVNSHLAACVQIFPEIESIYRWNNEVQREQEVLILAKTSADKFAELEKSVRAVHSYETPEIIAVPASQISEPYRAWLNETVGAGS
jgi:periplasmic divalent cation tolerance protein